MTMLGRFALRSAAFLAFIVILARVYQSRFRDKERRQLPGPSSSNNDTQTWPWFGAIFAIVSSPHKFWETQRSYGPLSWNIVCGVFMVFAHDLAIVRQAFAQNGKDSFTLMLHPNANAILGKGNIAFMSGAVHRRLRASFITLFTPKALATYLETQLELIQMHMTSWANDATRGDFVEMWSKLRDLNAQTSQRVFLGTRHLRDPARFSQLFVDVTNGFLSFPLCIPGTGLYRAVRARREIESMLKQAVQSSKAKCVAGEPNEAGCLLDFWMQHVLKHKGAVEEEEMSQVMMDFLFAAQDASTSSLAWTLCLMVEYPNVLDRVRAEQVELQQGSRHVGTFDRLQQMTYTRAVVMEILRFCPPAPMVPFLAERDMQITPDFVLPKGSMFVADIWKPTREGFPNGLEFDPDRMLPDRREDLLHKDAFLTFGFGPHICVGQHYAVNHLIIFLSELALNYKWERKITPKSSQVDYRPTVCPGDCLLRFFKI